MTICSPEAGNIAYTPMKFSPPYTSIYIVKLGFTGVYCFLFLLSNIRRLKGMAVLTCTNDLYFDIKIRKMFLFQLNIVIQKLLKCCTLHGLIIVMMLIP